MQTGLSVDCEVMARRAASASTVDSGAGEDRDLRSQLAPEVMAALSKLRGEVHVRMHRELRRRTKDSPVPTEEELELGTYLEGLEPQVRDAVREMRRKGYATHSSGFYGYDHAAQVIEGGFELAPGVVDLLREMDVEVERRGKTTVMRFYPEGANLEEIGAKWGRVAELLPHRGRPAPTTHDFGSDEFRRLHREGELQAGFVQHWLDGMGTYEDAPEDDQGVEEPPPPD
jgi:hypothetical protein